MVQLFQLQGRCRFPNRYGRTSMHAVLQGFPLISIIYRSLPGVTRLLLEHRARCRRVNAPDLCPSDGVCPGHTPLNTATYWENVDVARVLFEHGANVAVEGDQDKSPLQIVSAEGINNMIKLLDHGASEGVLWW